jgi:hypothetical protein
VKSRRHSKEGNQGKAIDETCNSLRGRDGEVQEVGHGAYCGQNADLNGKNRREKTTKIEEKVAII